MFNNSLNKLIAGAALAVGLASSFTASATAIDVSATVASVGDAVAPIGAIGIAVLAVIVAIKTYKWVRRAP